MSGIISLFVWKKENIDDLIGRSPSDISERDLQHLRMEAKKADKELHSQGIMSYCLTLEPSKYHYVQRIFGQNY